MKIILLIILSLKLLCQEDFGKLVNSSIELFDNISAASGNEFYTILNNPTPKKNDSVTLELKDWKDEGGILISSKFAINKDNMFFSNGILINLKRIPVVLNKDNWLKLINVNDEPGFHKLVMDIFSMDIKIMRDKYNKEGIKSFTLHELIYSNLRAMISPAGGENEYEIMELNEKCIGLVSYHIFPQGSGRHIVTLFRDSMMDLTSIIINYDKSVPLEYRKWSEIIYLGNYK